MNQVKGRHTMKRGRPKGSSKDNRSFGPLGDLIRKARLGKSLGLADVAKTCNCSVQFISNIEHGRAPLPWEKAPVLAKTLNIPLEDLQAANLAIRSDFKGFVGGPEGKKISKPLILKKVTERASAIALAAKDSQLQELIQKYHAASIASRKKFVKVALEILAH